MRNFIFGKWRALAKKYPQEFYGENVNLALRSEKIKKPKLKKEPFPNAHLLNKRYKVQQLVPYAFPETTKIQRSFGIDDKTLRKRAKRVKRTNK